MGQVTIYLDAATETKLNAFIGQQGVSKSKWIADLIREKTSSIWPESIVQLAGAWSDMPSAEKIRNSMGDDVEREPM